MHYLKFLEKMTAALEQGKGIDTLWQAVDEKKRPVLSDDERHYLSLNEARFAVLGGKEAFVRRLAAALDIADAENIPEAECRKQSEKVIIEKLQGAMTCLKAVPGFTDMEHITDEQRQQMMQIAQEMMQSRGFMMFVDALMALNMHGDGKAWEALQFDYSSLGDNPFLKEIPVNPEQLLKNFVIYDNAAAFHYFLHESPDKEKYRAVILKDFPGAESEYEPLTHPLIRQVLDDKQGAMLADIFPLLSDEQKHTLFRKEPHIFWQYGSDVTRAALKFHPRDEIGTPHHNADRGGYYAKKVRDQDEVLAAHAARAGDSEFLQFIFSKYRDPEQITQILERDQMSALQAAVSNGHDECVNIMLGAISDANRKELTDNHQFMGMLSQALEQQDRALIEKLTAVLPPEAERSDYQKRELLIPRLHREPEKIDVAALRQLLQTQEKHELPFRFQNGVISGVPVLKKLVEAMPEDFMAYLRKPINPHILSEHRQRVLDVVPAALRAEAEKALDAIPSDKHMPSQSAPLAKTPVELWQAAHGVEASWIRNLPKEVLAQNPQGFNYASYSKLLPLMQTACRIEGDEGGAALNACKLATLFNRVDKAEEYLTKFAPRDEHQPIHDALLFDLPKQDKWDIEVWRQFALRDGMGPRALRLLPLAPKIEEAYAKIPKKDRPRGMPIEGQKTAGPLQFRELSLDQLYDVARNIAYEKAKEHPQLANLCIEHGIDEEHFNEALALLKRKDLPAKRTPAVHINGKDIGFPGFHLSRIKPTHPWCPFIGKLVNCCNYLGGATEIMARAQIEHPDCSLYVLTNKEGEPIAKCTGWMSSKGNFVFNAWERLSPGYDKFCEPFLLAAAIQVMEKNPAIKRVTLGANKGNAPFMPVVREEPAAPELASPDANVQYEVATQEKLALSKIKLQELTKKRTQTLRIAPETIDEDDKNVRQLRHMRRDGDARSLSA